MLYCTLTKLPGSTLIEEVLFLEDPNTAMPRGTSNNKGRIFPKDVQALHCCRAWQSPGH